MLTACRNLEKAVLPTPTDVVELDVRDTAVVTLSITNLDGSQTVTGSIYSSVWADSDYGPSGMGGLEDIVAGETRPVVVAVGNADRLKIVLQASGAGCDVRVSARPDGGRR